MRAVARWVFVVAGIVSCRRDDREVTVLPAGGPIPAGWSSMGYEELGAEGECVAGPGVVAFRRPEHTTNEATRACYEDSSGHAIAVSLALSDDAWSRAGWKTCTPAHRAALDACHP